MFLTAGLLVALRLGTIVPAEPCKVVGGTWTLYSDLSGPRRNTVVLEAYCDGSEDGEHLSNPPTPTELCDPSTVDYPCCTFYGNPTVVRQHQCRAANEGFCSMPWNGQTFPLGSTMETINSDGYTHYGLNCALYEPPAPPLRGEELSSGAIGGIVVGAYLGVAAIGGAVAAVV